MTMLSELDRVLAEMRGVFTGMESDAVSVLAQECAGARRVFLAGVGRNGLVLQAFAMRLMHLGVDAHFVGQLSAPPIGAGDLMIAAASIGSLPSLDALIATARRNGARALVISAKPDKVPAADRVIALPAQTMADEMTSALPLGSPFELALTLLCDLASAELMRVLKRSNADLSARHTNLL